MDAWTLIGLGAVIFLFGIYFGVSICNLIDRIRDK